MDERGCVSEMSIQIEEEIHLKGKNLLTLGEYTSEEINWLLQQGKKIKASHLKGEKMNVLQGKILGLIFEKNSTRTRVSFEAGMLQLGGQALYLNGNDLQLGRGESIKDTAKVLSQYIDGIMIRTFSHERVEELAAHATIPVINGLTDLHHPCQALADMLTIMEVKGGLKGVKIAYIGDGNNVAHSLMIASGKLGVNLTIATPVGYEPDQTITTLAKSFAEISGGNIFVTNDPMEAVTGADVIYTDVWTSMGQENENEKRRKDFKHYQVNRELVHFANKDYMFLHCLPAHRGEEVTEDVIDGKHSYVFQQAGNRLHMQKALLFAILSS